MRFFLATLLLGYLPVGWCADVVLTGQGQVSSPPDYVEMMIVVDAKCYATPAKASAVNDEFSRIIVDFLNTKIKKRDRYNNVIATGGFTLPYQNYQKDKLLCENTFQKQNTIIFRTQDIKNFEALFNSIQSKVYAQFSPPPLLINTAVAYVTISDPLPSLSGTLRSQLEQQALAIAFNDAKAKLFSLLGKTSVVNLRMTHASELPPNEPGLQREAVMSAGLQKAERAPVQFEDQSISKTVYFTFVFDDIPLQ